MQFFVSSQYWVSSITSFSKTISSCKLKALYCHKTHSAPEQDPSGLGERKGLIVTSLNVVFSAHLFYAFHTVHRFIFMLRKNIRYVYYFANVKVLFPCSFCACSLLTPILFKLYHTSTTELRKK